MSKISFLLHDAALLVNPDFLGQKPVDVSNYLAVVFFTYFKQLLRSLGIQERSRNVFPILATIRSESNILCDTKSHKICSNVHEVAIEFGNVIIQLAFHCEMWSYLGNGILIYLTTQPNIFVISLVVFGNDIIFQGIVNCFGIELVLEIFRFRMGVFRSEPIRHPVGILRTTNTSSTLK
jgi:hypothetical protein